MELEVQDAPKVDSNGSQVSPEMRDLIETMDQLAQTEMALIEENLSQLRDPGWIEVGDRAGGYDQSKRDRETTVRGARSFVLNDSICQQIVRLYGSFAIGKGIQFEAKSPGAAQSSVSGDGRSAVVRANRALNDFWNHRPNRVFTRFRGQKKLSKKLLVDGELFIAFFGRGRGTPYTLRLLDPLEITEIVSDPDDMDRRVGYVREILDDGKKRKMFYVDVDSDASSTPARIEDAQFQENVRVMHVAFEGLGQRGNSLLGTIMPWSRSHRRFMQARTAIQQALARFATKLKHKGGAADTTALKNKLASTITQTNEETNPQPAFGSAWVENMGVDMQAVKQETGAQAAQIDGNMLLTLASVSGGMFPHYMGAGESFRLATAQAMEAPIFKAFEAYQALWEDVYEEIFEYVLMGAGIQPSRVIIDIRMPRIMTKDVAAMLQGLSQLHGMGSPLAVSPEINKLVMTDFGVGNVDREWEEIKDKRPGPPPSAKPDEPPGDKPEPKAKDDVT